MAGKNMGKGTNPDGTPRLPGFFNDYGGSGVRLLPGQKSPAEIKKLLTPHSGKKK